MGFATQEKFDVILQGELFELSPATPLLSQAMVLGDRRTFSVYDLTQPVTFGTVRSLNPLIRWKSSEGEWAEQRMTHRFVQEAGHTVFSHI